MSKQEVELVETGGLVPASDARAMVAAFIAEAQAVEVEDPAVVEERIMAELLKATSLDELLRERKLTAWRDELLNVPVIVRSVKFNRSDKPGLPVYAVAELANPETGETTLASCGGKAVVVQLFRAATEGWLPARMMLVEGKETRTGGVPLSLVAAPEPF